MGAWGLLIAAGIATSPAMATTIAFTPQATVAGAQVTLGEIADLSILPPMLRRRAEALEVARFAPGHREMTVPASRVVERARARLPALAPWLEADSATQLSIRRPADETGYGAGPARAPRCLRLQRALPEGASLLADDLQPADCAGVEPSLRYDARLGVARATRPLQPGDVVPAGAMAALAAMRPGQQVALQARVGPVAVERLAEVVEPARAGRPVFVRTADGAIFAAPAPGRQP